MPIDQLDIERLRQRLSRPDIVAQNSFTLLKDISRASDDHDQTTFQELILRALENREHFGASRIVLDALVRRVGLFPYLEFSTLGLADAIAWEFNRPKGMREDIVFHE